MSDNEKYPIRPEWEEYYKFLEALRRTGVCNMLGASIYLNEAFSELTKEQAQEILCNWINNYDELNQLYGFRREWVPNND